jgi:transglutaminase 1
VWFLRRDLPEGRGGWQAIDATPQEKSEGRWQCGPASLVDVKAGTAAAESNYDLDFVLAEVNADVRYYVVDENSPMLEKKLRRVERDAVGTYVITKAVGYLGADDITSDYKHPEGTIAERVALLGEAEDSTFKLAEKGTFSLSPVGELALGEDIAFKLKLKDDAADRWMCRLALRATSYRGREIEVMAESSKLLEAGQELMVSVKPADYLKHLADTDFPVSAIVHCVDVENAGMWLDEVVSSVGAAALEVTVPTARPFSSPLTIRWKNPLPVTLTDCRLEVAAAGVFWVSTEIGELASGAELSETVPLKEPDATRRCANGHMQVVATLTSKELQDIIGHAVIKME